jgi:hypothetical protein
MAVMTTEDASTPAVAAITPRNEFCAGPLKEARVKPARLRLEAAAKVGTFKM